jgi:YQGE family putative transporter
MGKLIEEYKFFKGLSSQLRTLLMTNMVYALVLPIIELFIGAYIVRNSSNISMVMVFQLAQGTGIPITFILNAYLLRRIPIVRLYASGMILSGMAMWIIMLLDEFNMFTVGATGLMMGLAYGFFWANRVFLALGNTVDENRNYYYGLESFFFSFASIVMPFLAGYFITSSSNWELFAGHIQRAYYVLTIVVIILAVIASLIASQGNFINPPKTKLIYFRFHHLWRKMLLMASLKGVAQGFIIAAPVMLIMRLVGNEGALGTIQSIGSILSAIMLYVVGRLARPKHRKLIYGIGLTLFVVGTAINMSLFNQLGAIVFVGCLVFSRPLLDLAYFPVQLGVIECVAAKENRNHFAYLFSHEVGLYVGRVFGCLLFIIIARNISEDIALRYALFAVALTLSLSIFVLKSILRDPEWCEAAAKRPLVKEILKEPVELS